MDIKEVAGFKMIVETEMEKYRYDTFWSKEPETLAWIKDMQPGEVLYDVGANIGIYTLYAASRGVQVVAIEPVLENYVRLVQNVELNGFNENLVIPIYAAIGGYSSNDEYEMTPIIINKSDGIGSSGSQMYYKGINDINTIERLIFKLPLSRIGWLTGLYPHHIKIDVDGQEEEVLKSIDPEDINESVLIEVNQPYLKEDAKKWLGDKFTTDNKYNTMTPHSRERRQREGITAENVVFTRIA